MFRSLLIAALLLLPTTARADDVRTSVRTLVDKLDANSLADRKQAEEQIVALGTKALAHLPSSTRRLSVETRDRLARIRKTLEKLAASESIEPSLFSYIEMDQVPLALVLKELATSSSNRVYLPTGDGPRVDVKFEATPYWQVLDGLLDEAGMTIYPFADAKGFRLEPRASALRPRTRRAAYRGAFRFEATNVRLERDAREAGDGLLHIKLQAAWEPRLAPIAVGLKPQTLKIVDDADAAVSVDRATSGSAVAVAPAQMAAELELVLAPPPRSANSIASLAGKIAVLMPTARVRFEFDALDAERARREKIGDVSVVLDKVRKVDDLLQIGLVVQFKDAARGLESHLDWESKDEAYLIGSDGKKLLPVRREMQKQGDEVKWGYWFRGATKPADYRLVYDVPSDIVELEVPFELKDIKLP